MAAAKEVAGGAEAGVDVVAVPHSPSVAAAVSTRGTSAIPTAISFFEKIPLEREPALLVEGQAVAATAHPAATDDEDKDRKGDDGDDDEGHANADPGLFGEDGVVDEVGVVVKVGHF